MRDLKKHFPVGGSLLGRAQGWVKAVDGISFTINRGETLGLVGESGCGKTTTSKLVLAAEEPTGGTIEFEGRSVARPRRKELRDYRRKVQVVFQDPYSSLSPRACGSARSSGSRSRRTSVSRGGTCRSRVEELLELVGLRPDMARLFPHEFSGGQRQRLAIARALSTNARLIVLDEPVSALDVSIRAHIISLLEELQARLGVSYLFIAHDLAAVSHLSQQTAVMYLGKLVEVADSLELSAAPLHPYTKALFAASLPSHPDERARRSSSPARSRAPSTRRAAVTSTRAVRSSCRAAPKKSQRSSSGRPGTGRLFLVLGGPRKGSVSALGSTSQRGAAVSPGLGRFQLRAEPEERALLPEACRELHAERQTAPGPRERH